MISSNLLSKSNIHKSFFNEIVLFVFLCFLLSSNLTYGQSCETFDGFSNCGNNFFDCVSDGTCDGVFFSTGWENASGDDIDWSISDTLTFSEGTGPDFDHTSGTGKFLFTEASACYEMTAILLSPVYDLSSVTNPELQFWYHMYGLDMGSLSVEIEVPAGSGSWNNLSNLSGPQGNGWYLSTISLTNYSNDSVRFRFTGLTGPSFESDIALDDICVATGCLLNCNDGNPCTTDFCFNGSCFNQAKACDDGNLCTIDTCENGVCINTQLDCDDGDLCTFDYCFVGECYSDLPCDDFDACTIDSCTGPGNCLNTIIECDDGNPCSSDYCDFGVCFNEFLCDDFDACTIDTCDEFGNCHTSTPVTCDDLSSCTNDQCLNGACAFILSCNDNDPCTTEGCSNGNCLSLPASVCICEQSGDSVGKMAASITDSIVITNRPGLILDLNVSVDISHSYIGDLEIELISPTGLSISLFSGQCGNTADVQTVFDDDAFPLICPPSEFLSAMPYELLSTFNGKPINGTWKIRITDFFPLEDDGILNGWCLLPTLSECSDGSECDDADPCTSNDCVSGNCHFPPSGICNLTISGSIMTEAGTPVHTVTVNLTGNSLDSDITANDGKYIVDVSQGGNYTVTPSKSNDISSNNGISTVDILFIRRHILDTAPLSSPYKIIAADVNGSFSVSTQDIVLTRRVILQVTDSFPTGKLWSFIPYDHLITDSLLPFPYPDSKTYSDINASLTNQNFIAVKFGDLNNSWDPFTPKTETTGTVQFKMDEFDASTGQEITVPLKVKDFKNVTGYQFTLIWDATVLEFMEVNNKSLNGYYGTQKVGEGYLTTSWDDESAKDITLDDDEIVFELKFKVIGDGGSFSEIKLGSELTTSEAYDVNLDLLTINPVNGIVKVRDESLINNHQSSMANLRVLPNPFSNSTSIIFSIPKDESINLIIYDVLGREVKKIKETYAAGEHQIQWSGDNESGNELCKGLYHIKLIAGELTLSSKVVIIR